MTRLQSAEAERLVRRVRASGSSPKSARSIHAPSSPSARVRPAADSSMRVRSSIPWVKATKPPATSRRRSENDSPTRSTYAHSLSCFVGSGMRFRPIAMRRTTGLPSGAKRYTTSPLDTYPSTLTSNSSVAGSIGGTGAIPSSRVRRYSPVPPARIGSRPSPWTSAISLRAIAAQSAAEQGRAPSSTAYRRCSARLRSSAVGAALSTGRSR